MKEATLPGKIKTQEFKSNFNNASFKNRTKKTNIKIDEWAGSSTIWG